MKKEVAWVMPLARPRLLLDLNQEKLATYLHAFTSAPSIEAACKAKNAGMHFLARPFTGCKVARLMHKRVQGEELLFN